jgi:hypothetical protein
MTNYKDVWISCNLEIKIIFEKLGLPGDYELE